VARDRHKAPLFGATVAGGIVIGVFCGLALLGQKRWRTLPLEGYVEIFRCTPLLIQIVWFYYALPISVLNT
jgi:polar amino acid transport system permease protein